MIVQPHPDRGAESARAAAPWTQPGPGTIRVAHIALQLETGGMERLLADLARHTDPSRFSLRFVALAHGGSVAREVESCGWPVTVLGIRPGIRPTTVYRLARLFEEERIDIVHTHNTKPLLYAGPAARMAGAGGVVHTRHGQRRGATPRQNMLFRLACRCADRVVCVSNDSAALCGREGVDAGRLRTIWNGIDTGRFPCGGPRPGGGAVFVGRLSPEKDIATLLSAVALVAPKAPSFTLRIAGAGPCATELAALAAELGLAERVRFLGEVSDVPALLRTASLLVLPSRTEGLPVTVLEAMSCGLPVVATRVGGTPEAIEDGRTGLLVPPGDPAALAAALVRIASDAHAGRAMGLAGRRRAVEHFDVRAMIGGYEAMYQEILTARAAAAA